ncbi:type II toxin-antitoxin system VapB family antitoxin [Halomonas sp. EF61]|uniref:type II toxin-antitoxin system VapB family antitoxin n=1 Tax=Halomonas sp. EF61 TaxID=2950869 RepID=UPI0032DFAEBD
MSKGYVFPSNRSQAVRLPEAAALAEDVNRAVFVSTAQRGARTPADKTWDDWFDAEGASEDFMEDRGQPGHSPAPSARRHEPKKAPDPGDVPSDRR